MVSLRTQNAIAAYAKQLELSDDESNESLSAAKARNSNDDYSFLSCYLPSAEQLINLADRLRHDEAKQHAVATQAPRLTTDEVQRQEPQLTTDEIQQVRQMLAQSNKAGEKAEALATQEPLLTEADLQRYRQMTATPSREVTRAALKSMQKVERGVDGSSVASGRPPVPDKETVDRDAAKFRTIPGQAVATQQTQLNVNEAVARRFEAGIERLTASLDKLCVQIERMNAREERLFREEEKERAKEEERRRAEGDLIWPSLKERRSLRRGR